MKDQTVKQIEMVIFECGEEILQADRFDFQIENKEGNANFVTLFDKKIQEILKEKLHDIMPEAKFWGEEGEKEDIGNSNLVFIVDPIDGTTNFIKDYHMSCISVALIFEKKKQAAWVYNPYLKEMYSAQYGEGAFCNGKRIHVSNQQLDNGIVLFGTSPYYRDLSEKSFRIAKQYYDKALDIRRSGSAAIDLCTIACGRAEVYFELKLSPWDYAAGALIVEEAGGIITTIDNQPISLQSPCSIFARNNVIQYDIIK